MKVLLLFCLVMLAVNSRADVPAQSSKETGDFSGARDIDLHNRVELLLATGQNLSGNGFLRTSQFGAEAQYHVNQKWAVDFGYTKVFNSFTNYADQYKSSQGVFPSTDQAFSRIEARAQYHLYYGNVYLSDEKLVHFDQYIGFGLVRNELESGIVYGPVIDIGIVSWITKWITLHAGIKDYYYAEKNQAASNTINGYLLAGILF